jgi:hypothetical protein
MAKQMSFVRATKDYFESGVHGRKVEVPEFKALSAQDKVELRDLLIAEGYDVLELGTS